MVPNQLLRPTGTALLRTIAVAFAAIMTVAAASPAMAQTGWTMPWDKPQPRRSPRPQRAPEPGPIANQQRSDICLQLEQRLVQESSRGANSQDVLPRLDADIRRYSDLYRASKSKLENGRCYDQFLFIKTLKNNRRCRALEREVEDAKIQLRSLQSQRQQVAGGSRSNNYQDEIIASLARNNCGSTYQQEARRRSNESNPFSSSFWQDNDSSSPAPYNRYGALPFATYRTLCVRLCDGYYFPVSFSTLPNHFQRDADACQAKCAAPVDLYYYQNPGSSVEQMISATKQTPYSQLKTAFTYRKKYIQGCSCKQAEYVPGAADGNKKAEFNDFRTTTQRR